MAAPVVKNALIPFKGNINPGDPQGIRTYHQATKDIDKEYYKLNISLKNNKDIIDHFISLSNKYGWGRLALIIDTGEGANNIFRKVDKIQLAYIHHQSQ